AQLQRLKRSLSFKTKSLRSRSADNVFERSDRDSRGEGNLILTPALIPNAALRGSPSSPPPPQPPQLPPASRERQHDFQEHVFKKPTFCDICNHMIVGGSSSKHGLRCKACKLSLHHRCLGGVEMQRCMGKMPKGFRRHYSSPLLINEQFSCIMEVIPLGCGKKVDPVYETLRFGTSLAQRVKGRGCEGEPGPCRHSNSMDADLMDVPEEMDIGPAGDSASHQSRQPARYSYPFHTKHVFCNIIKVKASLSSLRPSPLQMYQYVALSQYVPQDSGDLAIQPGDILSIVDDSNEEWWKGRIDDRVGFFPANFVQRVRPGERVFRCVRACAGTREHGQLALNLEQICVEKASMPAQGLVRVQSGRKKGLVPIDCLEEI
uniref:SH3 and cysteine rich domain n=1 Tax=Petromyzon marinus TaxID=7757 RepID=S4REJ9_PETMA